MVREVEFSNEMEIIHPTLEYSNAADQPMFEGYLEDEALTLQVKVHVPLHDDSVAQRKLFLYYTNIDFDNKLADYVKVGEVGPDFKVYGEDATDKTYEFDLSSVLTIPRKIYNTGGTSEITIELYTYEANLSTDYGSKTLSVPYSINNDSKYKYDKSTDGVYRLVMIDFDLWTATRTYGLGDIVVINNGTIVKSIVSNNTDDPNNPLEAASWSTPTDDEIFSYSRGVTKYPPIRSIISNVMLSRYAKYNLIKESLLSTSFKQYDNDKAFEMTTLLQDLREKAKYKLMLHKPIDAAYYLHLMKLAASPQTDTTKITTYNVTYYNT